MHGPQGPCKNQNIKMVSFPSQTESSSIIIYYCMAKLQTWSDYMYNNIPLFSSFLKVTRETRIEQNCNCCCIFGAQ